MLPARSAWLPRVGVGRAGGKRAHLVRVLDQAAVGKEQLPSRCVVAVIVALLADGGVGRRFHPLKHLHPDGVHLLRRETKLAVAQIDGNLRRGGRSPSPECSAPWACCQGGTPTALRASGPICCVLSAGMM
jgi:hypothetical protein